MLSLRVLIGTLWSGVLFIAGLSVAARHASQFAGAEETVRFIGIGFASLGMFVFSCVVADRLFPRADPRLCTTVQVLFGIPPLAAVVCVGVYLVRLKLGAA